MDNEESKVECCICHESLLLDAPVPEGEPARKKAKSSQSNVCCPPCGHLIHRNCLIQWFEAEKKAQEIPIPKGGHRRRPTGLAGSCPKCRTKTKEADLRAVYFDGEAKRAAEPEESEPENPAIANIRDLFEKWANAGPEERKLQSEELIGRIIEADFVDTENGNSAEHTTRQSPFPQISCAGQGDSFELNNNVTSKEAEAKVQEDDEVLDREEDEDYEENENDIDEEKDQKSEDENENGEDEANEHYDEDLNDYAYAKAIMILSSNSYDEDEEGYASDSGDEEGYASDSGDEEDSSSDSGDEDETNSDSSDDDDDDW